MDNERTGPSMFALDGRVALVTGSSRGIGFALARALAGAGAHVVLNARSKHRLAQAAAALSASSGTAVDHRAADVTSPTQVADLVAAVESGIGPIEILVNNAGMQRRGDFLEFPVDDLHDLVDVNLTAPFVVSQTVARHMAGRGRGRIINVCSVQSQLARQTITAYTATKGGLAQLTRGMCADLGPHGIQVNGIAPGYVATALTQALVDDEDFSAWLAQRTPAGRWGRVEELGGAVVFLAGDASSFVNGQILYVDGGITAVV